MTGEDWGRLLLHFPWGALAALIYIGLGPPAGITVLVSEFIYEAFNDWRKCDASFRDVLGIVWGFSLPLGVVALWRLST